MRNILRAVTRWGVGRLGGGDSLELDASMVVGPARDRLAGARRIAAPGRGADDRKARRDRLLAREVVALAAKLAKVDGAIGESETAALRARFRFEGDRSELETIFERSKRSAEGFERHARAAKAILGANAIALRTILDGLFAVAAADGPPNRAEIEMLTAIAEVFDVDRASLRGFARIWRAGVADAERRRERPPAGPREVLGVAANAGLDEIKAAYKRLALVHHPDRIAANGGGDPQRAADRFAEISAAYATLTRSRP